MGQLRRLLIQTKAVCALPLICSLVDKFWHHGGPRTEYTGEIRGKAPAAVKVQQNVTSVKQALRNRAVLAPAWISGLLLRARSCDGAALPSRPIASTGRRTIMQAFATSYIAEVNPPSTHTICPLT